MRITANRRTELIDLALNQAEDQSRTPLHFTSPLSAPSASEPLVIVHPKNSAQTGGFFGMTRSGGTKAHRGIDLEASEGTPVTASEEGVVEFAGEAEGYGKVVYVNHRDGYQTRYAHLQRIEVKRGDHVGRGDHLGDSGKTGNADHPEILAHLHFEIRKKDENGVYRAQDPLEFITTPRPDQQLRLLVEGSSF